MGDPPSAGPETFHTLVIVHVPFSNSSRPIHRAFGSPNYHDLVRTTQFAHRLLVFVVPLDSNPYQESLYDPMRTAHPETVEVRYWSRRPWIGVAQFFPLAAWMALRGSRIAHVHWLAWDIRLRMPGRARLSRSLCLLGIRWLELLGFRLVWTVHNVLPHEPQTDDDLAVVRSLARACSAVIVHSATVITALEAKGISTAQTVVIPQGSYIGHYDAPPQRTEARMSLGLPTTGRIVLFFGLIRPYKGVTDLIETWSSSRFDGSLLIAGMCPDVDLEAEIESLSAGDPSVVLRLGFAPDDAVPTYFAACDCVCLPFRALTTSSSALVALSFARPLIAPRLGALQDLPDDVGYFYAPDSPHGLRDALTQFFGDDALAWRSDTALEYAKTCSWPAIAEQTFELYRSVVAGPRPASRRSAA